MAGEEAVSAQDFARAQQVGIAAAEAIDPEAPPEEQKEQASTAIRQAAAKQGLNLSDDDAKKLAGALVEQLADPLSDKMMENFFAAGAFDKREEAASTAPAEQAAEAEAAQAVAAQAPPEKKTLAERFLGR